MNTLPIYAKGEMARFDFRVPDGLGHWVYPDGDDPGLKVEFYDADNTLRFTATVASDPPLEMNDDYDETLNPEGGPYAAIEGLDLSDYALGTAEARVYAKVSGTPVLPCPSILAAFEVTAGPAEGPLYCTVEAVKLEAPGTWPESITDEMVTQAIAEAGREIDGTLATCYDTPFADVRDEPATPPLITITARKLAAFQCMVWMGRVNAAVEENLRVKPIEELMRLISSEGKAPLSRLSGYQGPVAVYGGDLARSDDETAGDILV